MSQHINLNHEITAHLASKGLHPTPQWLSAFLSTVRPTTAPAAIKQTATFRLLASDITASLARNSSNSNSGSATFPPNIVDGTIKQRVLPGPLVVQVLDVEDVGRSRWSQVEELEAQARGETTKGREIIRVVDQGGGARAAGAGAGNAGAPGAANRGPHKLLLTDAAGTRAYGFELFSIDGVDTHMSIGAKLVLRNVVVARGMLLLEPKTTTVLGGKVEALHKAWHDGRMERLKAAAKMDERDRSRGS
ncbi:uncharacterized protein IWZ02DRAFT_370373 [Phyllosticta citriasiana]|uniref:uncharacterized protein n=1 Tax=Phyllosticta citriasiana TaxID=595635 RepID=UPI0030FD7B96